MDGHVASPPIAISPPAARERPNLGDQPVAALPRHRKVAQEDVGALPLQRGECLLGGTDRVIQYPEERRETMPVEQGGMLLQTYRGVHRLNKDEEGRPKCVACFMCSTACPARCIHIEAAESPWDDREKYPQKFDIDELRHPVRVPPICRGVEAQLDRARYRDRVAENVARVDQDVVARLDGVLKVTGAAKYAADQHPPDMLYAVLAVSSIARGRVALRRAFGDRRGLRCDAYRVDEEVRHRRLGRGAGGRGLR